MIQSDSFSKYVAPGLRMAWAAGHPTAIDGLVQVRQDFAVSALLARALERYRTSGAFDRHVAELRGRYRHKRDVTTAAFREHCEPLVSFREPTGGFYFWLRISGEVDWAEARALAAEAGVAVRAGDRFGDGADAAHHVRLSPIQVPDADIEPGIAALGRALRAARRGARDRGSADGLRSPAGTRRRPPRGGRRLRRPRGTPRTSRPPSLSSRTTAPSSQPAPASTAPGCRGATSCAGCGAELRGLRRVDGDRGHARRRRPGRAAVALRRRRAGDPRGRPAAGAQRAHLREARLREGLTMPKALSHTVVFTDDIVEAVRLCTEVAGLSTVAPYEVAAEIAERLFGWTGLTGRCGPRSWARAPAPSTCSRSPSTSSARCSRACDCWPW